MSARAGLGVQIWLGVSALLVVGLFGATHRQLARQAHDAEVLEHSHEHIELTVRLLAQLQAAHASALAYMLTADRREGDAFQAGAAAIAATLAEHERIAQLMEETEGEDIPRLREIVDAELAHLGGLVAARRERGLDAARERVGAGRDSRIGLDLQEAVALLQAREAAKAAHQNEQAGLLLGFVAAGGILSLLIVMISTLVFRRQLRRNHALFLEVEASGRDVELVNRFAQRLQVCRDVEEARGVVAYFLEKIFPGGSGAVLLIHASRNAMEIYCAWGAEGRHRSGELFDPHDCWALRNGRVHVVEAAQPDLVCSHLDGAPPAASCCVPMLAQGESLGILSVEADRNPSPDCPESRDPGHRQRLAESVAAQVATAIASLRLRESLRTQSVRDLLTGLFNRRYLEETAEREQLQALRADQPMSVILLDLDHFKQFNDSHGHQAGDHLLKTLGAFLRREVRSSDIACRYGGEEFVLVLPGAGHAEALRRAETLREGLGNLEVRLASQTLGPVTASFGVATFPGDGDGWPAVLEAADQRLYQAKQGGRDRVVGAPDFHGTDVDAKGGGI